MKRDPRAFSKIKEVLQLPAGRGSAGDGAGFSSVWFPGGPDKFLVTGIGSQARAGPLGRLEFIGVVEKGLKEGPFPADAGLHRVHQAEAALLEGAGAVASWPPAARAACPRGSGRQIPPAIGPGMRPWPDVPPGSPGCPAPRGSNHRTGGRKTPGALKFPA